MARQCRLLGQESALLANNAKSWVRKVLCWPTKQIPGSEKCFVAQQGRFLGSEGSLVRHERAERQPPKRLVAPQSRSEGVQKVHCSPTIWARKGNTRRICPLRVRPAAPEEMAGGLCPIFATDIIRQKQDEDSTVDWAFMPLSRMPCGSAGQRSVPLFTFPHVGPGRRTGGAHGLARGGRSGPRLSQPRVAGGRDERHGGAELYELHRRYPRR